MLIHAGDVTSSEPQCLGSTSFLTLAPGMPTPGPLLSEKQSMCRLVNGDDGRRRNSERNGEAAVMKRNAKL